VLDRIKLTKGEISKTKDTVANLFIKPLAYFGYTLHRGMQSNLASGKGRSLSLAGPNDGNNKNGYQNENRGIHSFYKL